VCCSCHKHLKQPFNPLPLEPLVLSAPSPHPHPTPPSTPPPPNNTFVHAPGPQRTHSPPPPSKIRTESCAHPPPLLLSNHPQPDAPPESWADLVGVSPVAPLTQSPTPSNDASQDDEEEGEDAAADRDGAAAQQQQEQPEPSSSNGSGQSSSSSSSNDKDLRELMRRSSSAVAPSAAAGGVNSASSAVSFMFVCDPKFPQVRQMLAGLDFAFPDANKVRGTGHYTGRGGCRGPKRGAGDAGECKRRR